MRDFNRDDNSGQRRDFGRRDFGNRGFGGGNGGGGGRDGRDGRDRPRKMFKAVCDNCGKECEVPFEPTDGRPVFCSECFEKRDSDRGPRKPEFERRDSPGFHGPRGRGSHGPGPHAPELFAEISRKLDKIIEILSVPSAKPEPVADVANAEEKKKKPAKKKSASVKK